MDDRKNDAYDLAGDNTSEIDETSARITNTGLNTPRRLFVTSLPKEIYMINKTVQIRDLLQNSTDEEKLVLYAQMEEEYQIHAQNPTLLNTPQYPTSTNIFQPQTSITIPIPTPTSSPFTRITDKESVITELNIEVDANEYVEWKDQVLGQLSLYPHFQMNILTKPRASVYFRSGTQQEIDNLYIMLWLRLWRATHKLQRKIPDLTLVKQPNVHLLWTTIRDHFLPKTMDEISAKVQALYSLRQGADSVPDFIAKVRRGNDVLRELRKAQTDDELKSIISIGFRDKSMSNLISVIESLPFPAWCEKLINHDKRFNSSNFLESTSSSNTKPMALLTNTYHSANNTDAPLRQPITCNFCSRTGHKADKCFQNPASTLYKAVPTCDLCSQWGHSEATCHKNSTTSQLGGDLSPIEDNYCTWCRVYGHSVEGCWSNPIDSSNTPGHSAAQRQGIIGSGRNAQFTELVNQGNVKRKRSDSQDPVGIRFGHVDSTLQTTSIPGQRRKSQALQLTTTQHKLRNSRAHMKDESIVGQNKHLRHVAPLKLTDPHTITRDKHIRKMIVPDINNRVGKTAYNTNIAVDATVIDNVCFYCRKVGHSRAQCELKKRADDAIKWYHKRQSRKQQHH